MAPRRRAPPLEEQLAVVRAQRDAPDTPALRAVLSAQLRGVSLVAARTAQIIADRRLDGFEGDLRAAWARFITDPIRRDPSCGAKLAILEALDAMDDGDLALYAAASRLEQREPAWGPPVDTAPPVRARAALALGRTISSDALVLLGALLADEAPPVRRAAIEAIEARGGAPAAALLALRFCAGDDDPVAYGECASALVRLAPEEGVALIVPRLSEAGTLLGYALAESRSPAALAALEDWLEGTVLSGGRAPIIDMIGAHRTDRAEEVLLSLVEDGALSDAERAIVALARRAATESARQRLIEATAHDPVLYAAARAALSAVEAD
ncbi:MAG: hypothetical protein ACI8S6_002054 [Myxococcota bacterium]|jgi:hypothetical protein